MTAPLRLIFAAIATSAFVLLGSHTRAQEPPITFSGLVFVDAAVASNPAVEVRVGQVICSQPGTPIPAPEGAAPADSNRYLVTVISGRERPGCPTLGATLTILVNGSAANQSPVLTAGSHNVDLFVGPDLAVYSGVIEGDVPPAGSSVTASVAGAQCGAAAITLV
jgi:hypothetical protein